MVLDRAPGGKIYFVNAKRFPIHRDFMALWNTGRFDDIRVEREAGKTGWILRFIMAERRVIRAIKYDGNK